MNKEEIQKTIDRYNQRLKEHGISEKALGWGDKGRSRLRFEILCSVWDFQDKVILDYGCGFGDLYQYIKETHAGNFKYIGIDLNENIIEIAKSRQYENAEFYVVSEQPHLLLDKLNTKIDYILSSGIFNYKLANNSEFIKNTFTLFNKYSAKGFASNFLSDKVDFKSESNHHSNPAEIVDLCYQYSNNIVLKNNYMPYEFTVFVSKGEPINKDFNVYENFLKYI